MTTYLSQFSPAEIDVLRQCCKDEASFETLQTILGKHGLIAASATPTHNYQADTLHLLLDQTSDGFWDWDLINNAIYFSPRWKEMFGYGNDELPNTFETWANLIHEEDRDEALAQLVAYCTNEEDFFSMMQRYQHKSGVQLFVLSRAQKYTDDDGNVVRLAGFHTDLTELVKSQQLWQKSEARYRAVVETQTELICRYDHEYIITFVNTAFCRYYNLKREEIVGHSFWQLIPPEQQDELKQIIDGLVKSGQTTTYRIVAYNGQGERCWQEWTDTPIFDDGELIEIQSIGRDITDLIHYEDQVRESEERYRAIVNQQTDFVTRWLPDFTVTFVNDAYCNYYATTPQEMIGSNLKEWLPSDKQAALVQNLDVMRSVGESIRREQLLPTGNGEDRWQEWIDIPIFDIQGNFIEVQSVGRDVHERRLILQELELSRERLNLAIEGAGLGVWDWNVQTDAVDFNERWAAMLGYPLSEIAPHIDSWMQRIHPEDRDYVQKTMQAHLAGKLEYYETAHRLRAKTGDWIWVFDRGEVVERAQDGSPRRVTGIHLDITARKRAEDQELELKAERKRVELLSTFITKASHEFRTPLSIINSAAYIMLRQPDETERQRQGEKIKMQVKHITTLLDSLLLMSRLDSGLDLSFYPMRLNSLIDQIIMTMTPFAEASDVQLRKEIDETIPMIMANNELLGLALRHLVDNAIKFTDRGGHVLIRSYQDKNNIYAAVIDNGRGIGEREYKRIFERFYRGDPAHSTRGFGLGLPIAKRIVENHGGRLQVETVPGDGSIFTICLPNLDGALIL